VVKGFHPVHGNVSLARHAHWYRFSCWHRNIDFGPTSFQFPRENELNVEEHTYLDLEQLGGASEAKSAQSKASNPIQVSTSAVA
jgi:hypothetical protein